MCTISLQREPGPKKAQVASIYKRVVLLKAHLVDKSVISTVLPNPNSYAIQNYMISLLAAVPNVYPGLFILIYSNSKAHSIPNGSPW